MKTRRVSIKAKLLLINFLTAAPAFAFIVVALVVSYFSLSRGTMSRDLAVEARIISANVAAPLVFNDRKAAEGILGALKASPDVLFAQVYDKDGRPFASYRRNGAMPQLVPIPEREGTFFERSVVNQFHAIVLDRERVGSIYIRADLTHLYAGLLHFIAIAVTVFFAGGILTFLLLQKLQKTITDPVLQLTRVTREVSKNRVYSVRARVESHDELGALAEGFNDMLEQIQIRDRELERHRSELESLVQNRTQQLEKSNQELQQFAYIASHDLQEPLRMISSYLTLIERRYKDELDNDAREFISFAVNGATRLRDMINGLLQFSRVQTRAQPFAPADTSQILDQAMKNLQIAVEERHAEITRSDLPTVLCDASQLTQVFQNLVSNAIKFSKKGEPPRIHVSAKRSIGFWTFSVQDQGIGIDPKYRDRLFVMFQRLHGRGEYPGTGIGLALCKRIIDRHGGRIWVESAAGKGSTFLFTIPTQENP